MAQLVEGVEILICSTVSRKIKIYKKGIPRNPQSLISAQIYKDIFELYVLQTYIQGTDIKCFVEFSLEGLKEFNIY